MQHELKIHPMFFNEIVLGLKKFEIRLNDRDYQENDILILNEYSIKKKKYTGEQVIKTVWRIWDDLPGLEVGYVLIELR